MITIAFIYFSICSDNSKEIHLIMYSTVSFVEVVADVDDVCQ